MRTSKRKFALYLSALLCLSTASLPGLGQAPAPANAPEIKLPTGTKAWTGDLDTLLKRRVIRVGVQYSKTFYYTVNGVQHGIAFEIGQEFEKYLNKKYPLANKNLKTHVVFLVTPRDQAGQRLLNGNLDIIASGVKITPERQKVVDFSEPAASGVNEIVVTAPSGPKIASVDDLAGKIVYARKTSSYWEHMQTLNERFQKEGKPAIQMQAVPDDLGDEDLLEMVNSDLLSAIVVNDWTAKLWNKLLPKIQVHTNVAIDTGGAYAWAVRKNSPKLMADINDFFKTHRQGTAFGQELMSRYVSGTYMLKQAVSPTAMKQFESTAAQFKKYAAQYNTDYLLMMAEGYQESGLDQGVKSSVGAVGVMQLMPTTGKEMGVGDITDQDANIHAGIKYFHDMEGKYFGNEPNMNEVNKVLFTFAAYNCGPARIRQLRAEAAAKGLDPNVWMDNVEVIAAARIGMETVTYVSNIYKYYVAYKLIAVEEEQRKKAREAIGQHP
jgi:membrane-bound lytic murein transglycosylase MltF